MAVVFAAFLPRAFLTDATFKASEVHLACAGIIGTALALVFSLSIIPAQKAAELFSAAILKLYAHDWVAIYVFALLSWSALLSVVFGTNWTFHISPRYSLASQFVLLGLSLDAIKLFYGRTLSLLVPETALGLVLKECTSYIHRAEIRVERSVRILQMINPSGDSAARRRILHSRSNLSNVLVGWIKQLQEFAYKGVARRDTQAVNAIIATASIIGARYADARRSSLILRIDRDSFLSGGAPDVGDVLDPIYETIRIICQDAVKASNEVIVQHCIRSLGDLAARCMTIVHDREGWGTAPLAFSPVFYIGICSRDAAKTGMDDALLEAISSLRKVFEKISANVDTRDVESEALKHLYDVALAGYARQSFLTTKSVEMMLAVAKHELSIREFRHSSTVINVLDYVSTLVPLEIIMEQAGKRVTDTFPAYSLGFHANIAALLDGVAKRAGTDPGRPWVSPFGDFLDASEAIIRHYRGIAEKVNFQGTLLLKWVVDSLIRAAHVHVNLLTSPPIGSGKFLQDVDKHLQSSIHTTPMFFRQKNAFPHNWAEDASGGLSILGMRLLKLGRLESALACADAIAAIARQYAESGIVNSYDLADLSVGSECLARAAEALGYGQFAERCRLLISKSTPDISDSLEYENAIRLRISQLNEKLESFDGEYATHLPDDPAPFLQRILKETSTGGEAKEH